MQNEVLLRFESNVLQNPFENVTWKISVSTMRWVKQLQQRGFWETCVLSRHLGESRCEQHAEFLVVSWRRLALLTTVNYEHLFPTSTWGPHVSGFKWALLRVFTPWKLAELQITALPTSLAPASLCASGARIQYSLLLSFEFVSNRACLFVLQPLFPGQHSWSLQSHHCLVSV